MKYFFKEITIRDNNNQLSYKWKHCAAKYSEFFILLYMSTMQRVNT